MIQLGDKIPFLSEVYTYNIFFWQGVRLEGEQASDVRDKLVRDQRIFGTIGYFATSKYNFVTYLRDGHFVSFNAYAYHEVHFVAKFIWSRTKVPKSSRHEVTFHRRRAVFEPKFCTKLKLCTKPKLCTLWANDIGIFRHTVIGYMNLQCWINNIDHKLYNCKIRWFSISGTLLFLQLLKSYFKYDFFD